MVLTLFSDVGCGGSSAVIKEKEINLAKAGVNFHVKVVCKHDDGSRNDTSFELSLPLWKEIHGFFFLQKDFKSFYAFLRMEGKAVRNLIKCKMNLDNCPHRETLSHIHSGYRPSQ